LNRIFIGSHSLPLSGSPFWSFTTPTEAAATTDPGLCTPDHKVFFAETGDTLEVPVDQYLEDISDDELSANASAYETTEAKNAGRLRNQKRVDQRRWLQEALPIHNLNAALDFVTAGNHTTPLSNASCPST
jgi:hypothetical protein